MRTLTIGETQRASGGDGWDWLDDAAHWAGGVVADAVDTVQYAQQCLFIASMTAGQYPRV